MTRRLLWTTGLILALASPAIAQTSQPKPGLIPPKQGIEGAIQYEAPAATDVPGAEVPAATDVPGAEVPAATVAPSADGEIIVEQGPTETRAEKLIGMDVTNPQGESLATVRDVIIDQNGQITGLVVSTGGFLGLGAKPVGIAWSAVTESKDSERLTVDLSKEQLAQAPEFKTKEAQVDKLLDLQDMRDDEQQAAPPTPANPPSTD